MIWQKAGLQSGVINASGDITSFGSHADGSPWNLGISNPDNKNEIQFHLPMDNLSVATSGNYEQFFMYKGKRYSHTIHPKSGLPITGIKSVSVFSPKAELSDALATAVFVMGVDTGLHFINQLPQTHAIVIDEKGKNWFSDEIKIKKGFETQNLNPPQKKHTAQNNHLSEQKATNRMTLRTSALGLLLVLLSVSCTPLAPYERIYLNDPEMQMGHTSADGFEHYIHSIREGATPASGAKTSGGCGCN